MKCPFCGHTEDRVVDSRISRAGDFIRRRRECSRCHRRYTSYEYIEDMMPQVVKRDGRREPFDRQKLRRSILRACDKRSVTIMAVDDIVTAIEGEIAELPRREVQSEELGKHVMGELRRLDIGAYIRYGSVFYRHGGPEEFLTWLRSLKRSGTFPEVAGRMAVSNSPTAAGKFR